MNAIFLNDLAAKTRRGQRGRVEKGRSGGGLAYGYDVIPEEGGGAGGRVINEDQARVIRRIFRDSAEGRTPGAIADMLNRDGVPGPGGRSWKPTTIRGHRIRGTGLLNNDLYRGVLVWNRQSFVKDPCTGKRQARMNPEQEWVRKDVPELRIVDENLWQAIKKHQDAQEQKNGTLREAVRKAREAKSRDLMLGSSNFVRLLGCAACGADFCPVGRDRYGCADHYRRKTCANGVTLERRVMEAQIRALFAETSALIRRQSNILDEGLKDVDRALAMVDATIARFGMLPALVRQKAKVLGQNGRDSEAADLIVIIEDTVGGPSKLERGLALRDGGTSAARSGRFDIAARLYGKALNAIDDNGGHEALAAGLRVDLAMALWDGGERGAALMRLTATPLADMLADPQWRDAVIRLAVDVLVARHLQGRWEPDFLDKLRGAWSRVVGDESLVDAVLKAATRRYAVGASAPFNVGIAFAAAREDNQIAADPAWRFHRDMMFVGHVSQSMARRALEPLLVPALQRGWAGVLTDSAFGCVRQCRIAPRSSRRSPDCL